MVTAKEIEQLEHEVYERLKIAARPLSEYELLRDLMQTSDFFQNLDFNNSASLFKGHFVIYHVLYRLNDKLCKYKSGCIKINAMAIELLPINATQFSDVARPDLVGMFYRDINNLSTTTPSILKEWLDRFWRRFTLPMEREQALSILNLAEPVSNYEIKSQYRRLVAKYHPDRYRDDARLKEINIAYSVLRKESVKQ